MKVLILTNVMGNNPAFENLRFGTKHDIIPTPKNERGLWVMGNGEPVRLLNSEYKIIDYES